MGAVVETPSIYMDMTAEENLREQYRVLDGLKTEYQVISDTEADVYGEISVTALTLALAEQGCEVESMHEHDEGLENYYINLVGGGRHA